MSTTSTVATASQSVAADPSLQESKYRYAHLLPHFSADRYPPLTPFEHVDPALRALSHDNSRAFLDNATSVRELTPYLGTEITGVNLAELDGAGRDQLALEVQPLSQAFSLFLIGFTIGC
jgi:sulfonate dioxygenase